MNKNLFINNLEKYLNTYNKIIDSLNNNLFPKINVNCETHCFERPHHETPHSEIICPEAPQPRHKIVQLKLWKQFVNTIVYDEKNISNEIFRNYFKYQNPLFLLKDSDNSNRKEQILNNISDLITDLQNGITMGVIPKNE